MNSFERVESKETSELQTSLPDVTVSDLRIQNLAELKAMFDKNEEFFGKGGIYTPGLFEMIKTELESDQPSPNRRMGVWLADRLVGFVSVFPTDEYEVEIATAVDEDFARRKIGSAANKAVALRELKNGNDVVGEIEIYNDKSKGMVEKLGYDEVQYDSRSGRYVYKTRSLSTEALMRRLGMF